MLSDIEVEFLSELVYRFANPRDVSGAIEALGFSGAEAGAILEFLAEAGQPHDLNSLIEEPFARKPQLEGLFGSKTRFSDGTWPVFYSSLEEGTAEQEAWHSYARDTAGKGQQAYYRLLRARFDGSVKDLRPRRSMNPELVGEVYEPCIAVAKEARTGGLDALLTPSARCENGTNVPVFTRHSLSSPELIDHVAFTIDTATGQLSVIRKR